MSELLSAPRRVGRRGSAVLAALGVSLVLLFAWAAGPVPSAHAEYYGEFCIGWLAPRAGCEMPTGQASNFMTASVISNNGIAPCIQIIGYYGEPIGEWRCAPAGIIEKTAIPPEYFGFFRARIRNQNYIRGGSFGARFHCCKEG